MDPYSAVSPTTLGSHKLLPPGEVSKSPHLSGEGSHPQRKPRGQVQVLSPSAAPPPPAPQL